MGEGCNPSQGAGCREDHGHLVPKARQGVAEGMHAAVGIGAIGGVGGEIDAGGSERDEARARGDGAYADGTGGLVTGAADHRHFSHSPSCCECGSQRAGDFRSFHESRHVGQVKLRRRQHLFRPSPPRHIEPKRAGGVRHLANELAGKAMPQPVLRQQHLARGGEQRRLVAANPDELRRREARHGAVAGDGEDFGAFLHPLAFGIRAAVVPKNGGAQYLVTFPKEHSAVHLAERPMASTLGRWTRSCAITCSSASHQCSGSCSLIFGPGRATSSGALASATTSRAASSAAERETSVTTAFTEEVPRSMPSCIRTLRITKKDTCQGDERVLPPKERRLKRRERGRLSPDRILGGRASRPPQRAARRVHANTIEEKR